MTTNPAFTDFLREQMRTHELDSVRQLSAWLGLSNSVVWSVMEGKQDPGLDFMIAVSRATGVNLADLVELARPGAARRRWLCRPVHKSFVV